MQRRTRLLLTGLIAVMALAAAGCGGSDSKASGDGANGSGSLDALQVPSEFPTIQAAVDAAKDGDVVLVAPGTYNESVDVTKTPNITIRGEDRNKVILDGQFSKENGVRVLDTDGVIVENMTARNYLSNGFYWTGSDHYRGSYLTAYRNGDYGIYAFDAYHGQFDHSLGTGSPDAGFYIGECYPCDAVVTNVVSEYNGLGYSGTNSGGDLYIISSTFRNNRAGIVPNTGAYELCYPERKSTVVGNIVHDNNYTDGPGIDVSLLAQGNGILVPGGVRNTIERNLVYNHDRTGIGLVPFPEEDANDVPPAPAQWDTPCSEVKDRVVPPIPADQCKEVPGLLKPCAVLWNPMENRVQGNVVENSKVADIAVATADLFGTGADTKSLGNCFSNNTFTVSAPANVEALAPCDGTPTSDAWTTGELDLLGLLGQPAAKPPKDSYRTTPEPGPQENMPNATTAPHVKFDVPAKPDLASITVPAKPTN